MIKICFKDKFGYNQSFDIKTILTNDKLIKYLVAPNKVSPLLKFVKAIAEKLNIKLEIEAGANVGAAKAKLKITAGSNSQPEQ